MPRPRHPTLPRRLTPSLTTRLPPTIPVRVRIRVRIHIRIHIRIHTHLQGYCHLKKCKIFIPEDAKGSKSSGFSFVLRGRKE